MERTQSVTHVGQSKGGADISILYERHDGYYSFWTRFPKGTILLSLGIHDYFSQFSKHKCWFVIPHFFLADRQMPSPTKKAKGVIYLSMYVCSFPQTTTTTTATTITTTA